MKKGPVIVIIAALALLASFFGYRSWKISAEHELAAQRTTADDADIQRRKDEADKQAAAQAEAARLARLDSEAAQSKLAQIQSDETAAEAARQAAEEDARKAAAEKERLEKERATVETEAASLTAEREKAEADAEAARKAAEQKLAELDQEKRDVADREAARLAALKHQQQLEAQMILQQILPHAVYPNDYKRREHYYLNIDMFNAELKHEAEEQAKLSPVK